jgi:hypothetical protein
MGSTPPLLDLRPSLPPSGGDLTKIKNARGNLDGERKSQVDQANYRNTFAKIGCG